MVDIFRSGCSILDELLDGGIEKRIVNTIYGPGSSGKTTLCMMAAISCVRNGKRAVYVDSENGFNTDRFKQLAKSDYEKILERIIIVKIKSFEEQEEKIKLIKEMAKEEKIGLFIIDTIGNQYRIARRNDPTEVNKIMAKQLIELVRIARDYDKYVLMANQVYSKMEGNQIKMVGGNMMEKFSNSIIELKLDDNKNRKMILIKYKSYNKNLNDNIGMSIPFEIKDEGIIEIIN